MLETICRCQTGVIIAVISLESIRNVFTNQPNVYTQRRAICLIVRPLGVDLIFIYLFHFFRNRVSDRQLRVARLSEENWSCFLRVGRARA